MDTRSSPRRPAEPSAPPALADLIAAGLVSHEMIGDPARLGSEAEALRVLCAEIGGPVWRLDPFHYAFRARPEDLGGRLAAIDPADWTAAIEAALAALGQLGERARRSGSAPPTSAEEGPRRSPRRRSCCCAPRGRRWPRGSPPPVPAPRR